MSEPLLSLDGLEVVYRTDAGPLTALHDIRFDVAPGEIVGIVGESGCAKSTLAAAVMGLLPANGSVSGGNITFRGRDLLKLSAEELRDLRGREMAMIFQDPLTSLNPTFSIGTQMLDAQRAHTRRRRSVSSAQLRRRAVTALEQVGIPDPEERLDRYPHEFSGGMRQRIMIAIALLFEPALLIADEPTSSLDVTLEAQILQLLEQLRREHNTAIMLVSHDLGVIAQTCDRMIVMYAGREIEQGETRSVFAGPQHPYTRALLASAPSRHRRGELLASISGRVPALSALPAGCKFADRCPSVQAVCRDAEPGVTETAAGRVRCYAADPHSDYIHGATPMPSPIGSST